MYGSQWRLGPALGLAFLLVLVVAVAPVAGRLDFEANGKNYSTSTVQLWYEGHWKQLDWLNGTVTFNSEGDLRGKVLVLPTGTWIYPYDPKLRKLIPSQPAGVLIVSQRTGTAGNGMFNVDGKDRSGINFPVVEAPKSNVDFYALEEGQYITIQVEVNKWKSAKNAAWITVASALLSLSEAFIMGICLLRLNQFYGTPGLPFWSIGPICLILELFATILRFAYTIVDPFFVHRMLNYQSSTALFTVHFPFALSSGILLTFYWAETLRTTQIKASPFVSQYRTVAILACVVLFVIELVCTILRTVLPQTTYNATTASIAFYIVVTVILTICYIATTVAIMKRINEMSANRSERIRLMTVRFLLSSVGFVATIILEICAAILQGDPWGAIVSYPLLFAALNFTTLLQVLGLRPIAPHGRSVNTANRSSNGGPISDSV